MRWILVKNSLVHLPKIRAQNTPFDISDNKHLCRNYDFPKIFVAAEMPKRILRLTTDGETVPIVVSDFDSG